MKNAVAALLAMGAALVLIPSALADSFGYKGSGSNVVANFNTNPSLRGFGTGVAGNGTSSDRNGTQYKSDSGGRAANSADAILLTGDGGISLDSLLNSGNSWSGNPVKGDAAAEVSSNELSLLSGGFSARQEMGAAGSGHFFFKDKGSYRASAGAPKGPINQAATVVALAETPEPGSLFLLGTGLLCMALALFWKSAKRTTES